MEPNQPSLFVLGLIEGLHLLIPFFVSSYAYITLSHKNLFKSAREKVVFKCFPLLPLTMFIRKMNHAVLPERQRGRFSHSYMIVLCFFFRLIGEYCLQNPKLYELGVISLTFGHVCLIFGYGFDNLHLDYTLSSYFIGLSCLIQLLQLLENPQACHAIFGLAAITMEWRSLTWMNDSLVSVFTCLCSGIFAIADIIYVVQAEDKVYPILFPKYGEAVAGAVHFISLFGITLGILGDPQDHLRH